MEDKTITETPATETSSEETPSSQLEAAAVEAGSQADESESVDSGEVDNTETSEGNSEEAQADTGETGTEVDKDLAKWAEAKGVSLDNEKEIKLAQMARESEKSMHQTKQEKSQLQKTVAPGNDEFYTPPSADADLREELNQVKLQLAVQNFYQVNPEARDLDGEMAALVQERPHLANDLEALYALTKAKQTSSQSDQLKKEGGKEALTKLANKQQAAAVKGSAVSTAPTTSQKITAQNVDELIAKNGHNWYMKNVDKINQVLDQESRSNTL